MIGGALSVHLAHTKENYTMPCVHLRELYELCEKHDLRIASPDAIRVVCRQCHEQEVCPTSLTDGEQVIELPRDGSASDVKADDKDQ